MPSCSVKNCPNRSHVFPRPKVKYHPFPKDKNILQNWLEACGKNMNDMNIKSANICSSHFRKDCFEYRPTLKRKKDDVPRLICRLKNGSIPTELLNLQKKTRRKKRKDSQTGILICSENLHDVKKSIVTIETTKDVESEMDQNIVIEMDNMNETEKFRSIKKLESSLKEITQENANLRLQIKNSMHKITELTTKNEELLLTIEQLKKNSKKEAENLTAKTLQKIFTPGQVKKLMKPKGTCVQWSADDISFAITLYSLNPEAYRFLRETWGYPYPSDTSIRNWCSGINQQSGRLDLPIKIVTGKGLHLSCNEEVTVLSFDELHVSNNLQIGNAMKHK